VEVDLLVMELELELQNPEAGFGSDQRQFRKRRREEPIAESRRTFEVDLVLVRLQVEVLRP
jgi:hypothetical protein